MEHLKEVAQTVKNNAEELIISVNVVSSMDGWKC